MIALLLCGTTVKVEAQVSNVSVTAPNAINPEVLAKAHDDGIVVKDSLVGLYKAPYGILYKVYLEKPSERPYYIRKIKSNGSPLKFYLPKQKPR